MEDAGEDVVNSEENDIDPGLLNGDKVNNAADDDGTGDDDTEEVSKKFPYISLIVFFDFLCFSFFCRR